MSFAENDQFSGENTYRWCWY